MAAAHKGLVCLIFFSSEHLWHISIWASEQVNKMFQDKRSTMQYLKINKGHISSALMLIKQFNMEPCSRWGADIKHTSLFGTFVMSGG